MPSKGILFLFSESKDLDYERLAQLASRFARHYYDLPAEIVSINAKITGNRTFRWPDDNLQTIQWNNYNRCFAFELSPYDETLLLDVDFLVQSDTYKGYFDSNHDFLCYKTSWDISGNDVFRHNLYISPNKFDMRWATVVFFKKNEYTHNLFNTWLMIQQEWLYYSKLFGFTADPFRNDYAMSIAHQIVNGYSNVNTFKYSLSTLSSTDEIIDYNNKSWLVKYKLDDSYNVLKYKGDLHVMNKKCLLEKKLFNKLWDSVE